MYPQVTVPNLSRTVEVFLRVSGKYTALLICSLPPLTREMLGFCAGHLIVYTPGDGDGQASVKACILSGCNFPTQNSSAAPSPQTASVSPGTVNGSFKRLYSFHTQAQGYLPPWASKLLLDTQTNVPTATPHCLCKL